MNTKIKILDLLFFSFMLISLSACVTNVKAGLNPQYEGYISARIATFPCQAWPGNLKFSGRGELNVGEDIQRQACDYFDDFIVEVFKNQPFIKGLSAKMSYRVLKQNSQESMLRVSSVWK